MPGIPRKAAADESPIDETGPETGDPIAAVLRATADDLADDDPHGRLSQVCERYSALMDAALGAIELPREGWSALVAVHAGTGLPLPGGGAGTLGDGLLAEPAAAEAWGADAPGLARRLEAMGTLQRMALVEAMDRYAGQLANPYHDAALRAAGARLA